MEPVSISAAQKARQLPALPSPSWRVAGAAVQGVSHQRSGLPCQDVQDFCILPDGSLLVALADGAGSARLSEQGARRAVQAALDALRQTAGSGDSWEDLLFEAFAAAREAVLQLADEEQAEPDGPRDYACTLTCVVATNMALLVGQVGDGAVVARVGEDLQAVTRLQRGEYANETHFLTQEDALEQLEITVVDQPVTALAVMSDGLLRLAMKMPAQEPHAPFFQPLFRFAAGVVDAERGAAQLRQFLNSERVNARTDDDKSLVLAVREPAAPEKAAASRIEEESAQNREGK